MTKLDEKLSKLHAKIHTLSTDAERQKLYAVLDEELQKQFKDTSKYHYSLKRDANGSYLQIDRKRHRVQEKKKISKSDQEEKKN